MKNYYQLLGIEPEASVDAIKHAFRRQIARYHPDKVQHLGEEFQAMAADRAAELTEAYRVLSDPASRADYDRQLSASDVASQPGTPSPAAPPSPPGSPAPAPPEPDPVPRGGWFSEERARGDAFVRKAALNRLRHALAATMGAEAEQPAVRGFDVAVVPKPKLFSRTRGPRLLVRFVARVDAAAIADAWKEALKWNVPGPQEICVLLMGSDIAPARELADAIGEQRRKPVRTAKVTLVPVDTRDWHAHLPTDAPALVRALLDRLHDQAR